MSWSEDEYSFMARAIEVAKRGQGKVRPNPMVGCVLVKDGKIIAEGWHDHLGGLHAEQMAIHDAERNGHSPNGATAFVTLEPCNHFGRTPPCTESLLWAGVKKVIIAHRDSNPTVRGEGIEVLLEAGITVKVGLMEKEARQQMQSFLNWCENKRPLVTFKIAVDNSGNVDDLASSSKRFTSEESLDNVHHLRNSVDAVIVGIGTVLRDDPSLNVRRVDVGHSGQPLRVVLDSQARIPLDCKMLTDGGDTLIIHTTELEGRWALRMSCEDGLFDVGKVLDILGDKGCQEVLLEGGPTTAKLFLESKMIDRVITIHADVDFDEGVPLGISDAEYSDAGLELVGGFDWGGDDVSYWSRRGLSWPGDDWPVPNK
jgi:diaminohydroxyphosphoribosylaminopyrimidine deaminase / 5-amino-6-(5-phosphoribosylamino)uracil reductase